MQGEVMAPLISSNLVDKIGKECKEKKEQAILDDSQKNDFGNQIKEDLKSLEIELNFEEIKSS